MGVAGLLIGTVAWQAEGCLPWGAVRVATCSAWPTLHPALCPYIEPPCMICPPACRCDQPTAEAFLASYCRALAREAPPPSAATAVPAPWPLLASWPRRPPGTPLSFVAMCYTLLHELGLLHDVFKRRPELWEARSLEQVQAELWGWLDCLFKSA